MKAGWVRACLEPPSALCHSTQAGTPPCSPPEAEQETHKPVAWRKEKTEPITLSSCILCPAHTAPFCSLSSPPKSPALEDARETVNAVKSLVTLSLQS